MGDNTRHPFFIGTEFMRTIAVIFTALMLISCGGQRQKTAAVNAEQKAYRFSRVIPPAHLTPEEVGGWMADHFWDRFDFGDTLIIERADSAEMIRVYAEYVASCVGPYNGEPIKKLMQKAAVSRKMLDYFVSMSEKLFHDPNSPWRSDELYIPVLEAQIAAPYYDEYEKMAPEYDLALASQNRINHKANDFVYTTANGKSSNLYSVKADFTLIYINNPGCPMCRSIQQQLQESALITELQAGGYLKIVALYPDEDISLWRAHPLPKGWISGYDKGCKVDNNRTYDLRAIPALYLLDKNKIVLVKDSTSVSEIEYTIANLLQ